MVSTTEELLKLLDPPGSCLYHYTRLDTVVAHILPSGRINMNPLAKMRDPRESKELNPVARADSPGSGTTLERTRRFGPLHAKSRGVKEQVKVLALTRDDLSDRDPETAIFGRGFARPRLWEQYADNHRGVCLCFDCEKLVRMLRQELAPGDERIWDGPVVYRDGPIKADAYTFPDSEFDKYSDSEIIDRLITRNKDELFFTKAKDWEIEFEYRLVVPTAGMEPLPVYVRDALRVVMLGELVGKEYTPSIVALLDEPGVKELEIRILRVQWQDGAPYLRDPTAFGYS